MQNQVALYLIFITGGVLIIASIMDWDYILGPKKNLPEDKNQQARLPLFTSFIHSLMKIIFFWNLFLPRTRGNTMSYLDHDRKNKRIFYTILGIVFIILGIIALNSGKFS